MRNESVVVSVCGLLLCLSSACDARTTEVDLAALRRDAGSAPAPTHSAPDATDVNTSDSQRETTQTTASPARDADVLITSDGGVDTRPACHVDECTTGAAVSEAGEHTDRDTCVRAVASNQGLLHQLTFVPNGDLFGVTEQGEVRRYRDVDCNGQFDADVLGEQLTWAHTGGGASNIAFDPTHGFLYVGAPGGVVRFYYCEDAGAGVSKTLVVTDLPQATRATVRISDGFLYASAADTVKRFALEDFGDEPFAWQDGETVSTDCAASRAFEQLAGLALSPEGSLLRAHEGAIYRIAHTP